MDGIAGVCVVISAVNYFLPHPTDTETVDKRGNSMYCSIKCTCLCNLLWDIGGQTGEPVSQKSKGRRQRTLTGSRRSWRSSSRSSQVIEYYVLPSPVASSVLKLFVPVRSLSKEHTKPLYIAMPSKVPDGYVPCS